MYCLDTNIIIDFFRGDELIIRKLSKLQEETYFITVITLCELYKGVYLSNNPDYNLKLVESFLDSVEVINFNNKSCKEFGNIFSKVRKGGKSVDEIDLMIASIVKSNNLVLITRNRKHFEHSGISFKIW